MKHNYKFKGLRELERKFSYELGKIDSGTQQGLTEAAYALLDWSREIVPVDTGRLRASGQVTEDGPFTRIVSYYAEDPNSGYDYAPIQHENLSFNHPGGKSAKFLENPFRMRMNTLIEIVGENVRKEGDL